MLLLKQLFITSCIDHFIQRVELLDGIYKLDSTLQNCSEDRLPIFLLYGSEKYALNVNKEIIRLTISYLKAFFWPTKFAFIYLFSFFFFNVWLYKVYCKWLYLTWVLLLVSSTFLGIIFHICCFIVSSIKSACKDPWYKKDTLSIINIYFESDLACFRYKNNIAMTNSIINLKNVLETGCQCRTSSYIFLFFIMYPKVSISLNFTSKVKFYKTAM